MKTRRIWIFLSALCILAAAGPAQAARLGSPLASKGADTFRFGITAPYSSDGYPLETLGIGAYLDWQADGNPSLPPGVEYIRVLRVSDTAYPGTKTNLPAWVAAHPGSVWIIGNEPDRRAVQDSITAEVYANRYFELAQIIRLADSTAKLGFGSIVQPTPLRLVYLERAWQRLQNEELAGSAEAASALVDIWSIHAFILNEGPGWGAGIPPGMTGTEASPFTISSSEYDLIHSNPIFEGWMANFRSWMAAHGERNKPLWITEYGVLFPTVEYRPDLGITIAETVDFMTGSFTYMLSAADTNTGMPADGNRLVQRWFWYSLNEYPTVFGGSLFDPTKNKIITPIGIAYRDYLVGKIYLPVLVK